MDVTISLGFTLPMVDITLLILLLLLRLARVTKAQPAAYTLPRQDAPDVMEVSEDKTGRMGWERCNMKLDSGIGVVSG